MRFSHMAVAAVSVIAVGVLITGCGAQQPTTAAEPAASPSMVESGGKKILDYPADQAPTVALKVIKDSESGWNLRLTTQRFRFTPGEAGGRNRPGGGHAHLYLDGEKIARIYGNWYHLGAAAVPKGPHTLTVQLNANDHTPWAANGRPIEASAEIVSTGAKSDGHDHEHHEPGPSDG